MGSFYRWSHVGARQGRHSGCVGSSSAVVVVWCCPAKLRWVAVVYCVVVASALLFMQTETARRTGNVAQTLVPAWHAPFMHPPVRQAFLECKVLQTEVLQPGQGCKGCRVECWGQRPVRIINRKRVDLTQAKVLQSCQHAERSTACCCFGSWYCCCVCCCRVIRRCNL